MGVTTSSNSAVTYVPIANYTLSSASPTVTFDISSTANQSYTDLILITADILNTTNVLAMYLQFNGNTTGNNYSCTVMEGNGSSASSGRNSNQNQMLIGRSYGGDKTMNIFQIQNYSNATTYKTALCRYSGAGSSSAVGAGVGLWRVTNAITSITVGLEGGYNFSSNCTFSLFGVKAA